MHSSLRRSAIRNEVFSHCQVNLISIILTPARISPLRCGQPGAVVDEATNRLAAMNKGMDINKNGLSKRGAAGPPWHFRLYVNGVTSLKTIITLQNLAEIGEKYLAGDYQLEVIDLAEDYTLGEADRVLALPTLVRKSPMPVRKILGNLSNTDQVITGLGLPGAET